MEGYLGNLPEEILFLLLSVSNPRDMISFGKVSKLFATLWKDETLWRQWVGNRYGDVGLSRAYNSWKKLYLGLDTKREVKICTTVQFTDKRKDLPPLLMLCSYDTTLAEIKEMAASRKISNHITLAVGLYYPHILDSDKAYKEAFADKIRIINFRHHPDAGNFLGYIVIHVDKGNHNYIPFCFSTTLGGIMKLITTIPSLGSYWHGREYYRGALTIPDLGVNGAKVELIKERFIWKVSSDASDLMVWTQLVSLGIKRNQHGLFPLVRGTLNRIPE